MSGPSDNIIIKGAQALTEDLSYYKGIIVGCGEASALVIAHILKGQKIDPQEVTNLIQSAANAGKLNGAGYGQTAKDVQWDLSQYGISSKIVDWNKNDLQYMFTIIDTNIAASIPVEIGVSNGAALTGESPDLRGHFITVVGIHDGNFVVSDPNSPQSKSGGFVEENPQQIAKSNPFALIVPSGTGPGTASDPGSNQFGIDLSGITNAITGIGPAIGAGIQDAIKNAIMAPFNAIGIHSVADLGWRTGLISAAIILFIVGFIALIFDFLKTQDVEVAGSKV